MNRALWLLLSALAVIWGVPYFFIKIALTGLDPAWIAFGRVALGAIVLFGFVPRTHWSALRRHAGAVAAIAFVDVALPFYLIANGERTVSSSLTGLTLAAIPIVVTVLTLAFDRTERLARVQVIGLVVGIAGVSALLGGNAGRTGAAVGGLALIGGATLAYSVGVLMINLWMRGVPKLAMTAAMLGMAAVMLAPPALAAPPRHLPGVAVLAAMAVLGPVCTAAAYVMYFTLIDRAGPIRASIVTYLNPAIAALLGVVVLHESMSVTAIAGLLLIVAGSWLSAGGPPSSRIAGVRLSSSRTQRPRGAPRAAPEL
jgi:drug/metabolite transporter (DMT)-like permease